MVMGTVVAELARRGPARRGPWCRGRRRATRGTGPGPGPTSTICFLTQSSRSRSARSASRWSPAAPSSLAGLPWRTRPGARAAGTRRRCRRAGGGPPSTSVAPVDLDAERVAVEQLLAGLALVGAGHVRGRHREEVDRPGPALSAAASSRAGHDGRGHPGRPEQVDLDGGVERGVEADRGGRVHDDVALATGAASPSSSSPSPSVADVAGHGGDPGGHLVVEAVPELCAQAVEAVVLEDLPGGPLHRGRRGGPGRIRRTTSAVGDGAQEPLDQGRAEEPGGAGDEEPPAGQGVADAGHRICLPYGK